MCRTMAKAERLGEDELGTDRAADVDAGVLVEEVADQGQVVLEA